MGFKHTHLGYLYFGPTARWLTERIYCCCAASVGGLVDGQENLCETQDRRRMVDRKLSSSLTRRLYIGGAKSLANNVGAGCTRFARGSRASLGTTLNVSSSGRRRRRFSHALAHRRQSPHKKTSDVVCRGITTTPRAVTPGENSGFSRRSEHMATAVAVQAREQRFLRVNN